MWACMSAAPLMAAALVVVAVISATGQFRPSRALSDARENGVTFNYEMLPGRAKSCQLRGEKPMPHRISLSRRDLLAGAAGTLAVTAPGLRRADAQAAKPNIVFILADDLGFADVSCYGQQDNTTPNVDRLALEGMKFTQAYANSAVCSATRTGLITGRYQYRLTVGLEEPIGADTPKNIGLPPSHPTMPSLLRAAGYATTLVGKWHLGFLPDFSPLKSGYDHFFGIFGGAADYFNHGADHARTGAESYQLHEDEVPVERHGYMTNLLGDRAVETIEGYAKARQPFLLSLHFTAPHWPWEGPDDEAESRRLTAGWCRAWTPTSVACCKRSTFTSFRQTRL
jgi:hypothetical protein